MRFACLMAEPVVVVVVFVDGPATPANVPSDLCFSHSTRSPLSFSPSLWLSTRTYPTHLSQIHLTFAVIICVYFVLFAIRRRRRRLFFNSFVARRTKHRRTFILFLFRCVDAIGVCMGRREGEGVSSSSVLIGRFDDNGNESNQTVRSQ